MKELCLLFIGLVSFANAQVIDSVAVSRCREVFMHTSGSAEIDSIITLKRFKNGILISDSIYHNIPRSKTNYFYDSRGNLLVKIKREYKNGLWKVNNIDSSFYDERNNVIYYSSNSSYDWGNGRQLSSYNDQNQKILLVTQKLEDGYYINEKREIWEYSLAGDLLKNIKYEWKNNNWSLLEQTELFYDQNHNDTLEIHTLSYGYTKERRFFNSLGRIDSSYKYVSNPNT